MTNVDAPRRRPPLPGHHHASTALELDVADDGPGISPTRRAGDGLASMRERAARARRAAARSSPPDSGTLLAAVLPLPDPA